MSIYTKTGDSGTTGLLGGTRVSKDDARVEACATVDETNSAIGVARAAEPPTEIDSILARIQQDLFMVGAELASGPSHEHEARLPQISSADIQRLEQAIDAAESQLPKVAGFVLPTGSRAGAVLHQARTVCRRAERRAVTAGRQHGLRDEPVIYLNRLGDLLYVLARRCNHDAGAAEERWESAFGRS